MKNTCSRIAFRHSTVCMLFVFVLLAVISFTGTATAVYADTFTVTTTIDDVSNPDSLRYAIENATSQDVITFDLEYPAIITLSEQLSIDHGLTIQGPGAENLAVSGGGECRVFYIEDTAESVDISGISIVSGDTSSEVLSSDYGGGMYNLNSSLTLTNCIFRDNNSDYGGGIYNHNSNPTITNSAFRENYALAFGGGMCNYYSSPYLSNSIFSENRTLFGGGMCNAKSEPIVANCTFIRNDSDYGGGMLNEQANPIVSNCTFSDNTTKFNGGGMINLLSSPDITNCTFSENTAIDSGGGMYNAFSSPTVLNCTFSSNLASQDLGGGMYNKDNSNPRVINCIFWDISGSEIYNFPADDEFSQSKPIVSFCVVQSNDVGISTNSSDITSADPELESLADNGGPTWTCALGEGSSAIDAGMTIAEVTTDQRGAPRPDDVSFDIGAYESGCFFINASWTGGGTIAPGAVSVNFDESVSFMISPDIHYFIEGVYVDGTLISFETIDNIFTYTFENVSHNHVISADFQPSSDDETAHRNSDGCNISALPGIALLLVIPMMFLSRKMK